MDTPDILSCGEARSFWVSWFDDIEVGEGTEIGQQQIMSENRSAGHDVNSFQVSTGYGASGTWTINPCNGTATGTCTHKYIPSSLRITIPLNLRKNNMSLKFSSSKFMTENTTKFNIYHCVK